MESNSSTPALGRAAQEPHPLLYARSLTHCYSSGVTVEATLPTGPRGHFLPVANVFKQVGNYPDGVNSEVATLQDNLDKE